MQKKSLIIIIAIITVVAGIVWRNYSTNQTNSDNALQVTNTVPVSNNAQALFNASFPDENGNLQALKQWQGKVIVLNFWATWCPPCREEMPELSELYTEYKDKNVLVLGLAIDEIGLIKEFSKETKISYPLLAAENGGMELATAFGNNKDVLPYTVIIKADGTIAKTYLGRISKPLLEETLKQIL